MTISPEATLFSAPTHQNAGQVDLTCGLAVLAGLFKYVKRVDSKAPNGARMAHLSAPEPVGCGVLADAVSAFKRMP